MYTCNTYNCMPAIDTNVCLQYIHADWKMKSVGKNAAPTDNGYRLLTYHLGNISKLVDEPTFWP